MSIFTFLKDAGEAVLNKQNPNSGDIQNHLSGALGGAVKDIAVELIGNMVKLKGNVGSGDLLEKAILVAGNIKGIEKVDAGGLNVAGAAGGGVVRQGAGGGSGGAGVPGSQFYTIVKGDTLSGIAKKFYGDGNKYHDIFEANRGIIKNADLIYPGQTIRIPPKK